MPTLVPRGNSWNRLRFSTRFLVSRGLFLLCCRRSGSESGRRGDGGGHIDSEMMGGREGGREASPIDAPLRGRHLHLRPVLGLRFGGLHSPLIRGASLRREAAGVCRVRRPLGSVRNSPCASCRGHFVSREPLNSFSDTVPYFCSLCMCVGFFICTGQKPVYRCLPITTSSFIFTASPSPPPPLPPRFSS